MCTGFLLRASRRALAVLILAGAIAVTASAMGKAEVSPPGILFDDFSYSGTADPKLKTSGWILRDGDGGPGVAGARWSKDKIAFIADQDSPGNRVVRLTSSTDGTGPNTIQTELYTKGKFYEGTYASRVRFTDKPVQGANGDNVLQTFFTITLGKEENPNYGENDFEYLPNGGWGGPGPIFYETTWENVIPDPWFGDRVNDNQPVSFAGWHTLVLVVKSGKVNYFIDGKLAASHGDKFYPEIPMSINYNLWFIDGGTLKSSEIRIWEQDIDWVYFAENQALTPEQVTKAVLDYRNRGVSYTDTVKEKDGPQPKAAAIALADPVKDGTYQIKITVPAHSGATSARLIEEDKLIDYRDIVPDSATAQDFFVVLERAPRDYHYGIELTNANGTVYSKELVVSVAPKDGATVNVALGKRVSGSYVAGSGSTMVDGDKTSDKFTGNGDGPRWLQIDLGTTYAIDTINVWHYWADARIYRDVIVQISNTEDFSGNVVTVFNNDADASSGQGAGKDAEYPETADGLRLSFDPTEARYVRLYTNGSSNNEFNHFVEVEVWSVAKDPVAR